MTLTTEAEFIFFASSLECPGRSQVAVLYKVRGGLPVKISIHSRTQTRHSFCSDRRGGLLIRDSNRSDFAQSGRIQTRSQIYIGIQHSIRKLVVHSARALLCVLSPQNALVEEALAGWEEA